MQPLLARGKEEASLEVLSLSKVQASLSEVIKTVRKSGRPVVITVNGEQQAMIVPVKSETPMPTVAECRRFKASMELLSSLLTNSEPVNAVDLIAEGRR